MKRCLRVLTVYSALAPCVAWADAPIDPHADLLYRQALPFLEQADTEASTFSPQASTTKDDLLRQGTALVQTLAPGVELLRKAVALDHPVAEYRLALYYMTYLSPDEVPALACPLLAASLSQGFAPASLQINSLCTEYRDSSAYRAALKKTVQDATRYATYYPQPAVRLECRPQGNQGLTLQWGQQRDFQAEVYRLLGAVDRPQRQMWYRKAVDANGCATAQHRLTSQR
ncbi:hypothetical protein GCM10009504_36380 [Pseudomonas laurentiana]|uniref:Sel1 repeat family protein n=1 Tax=Pseudomonas laurentiana TaxID=2364649 RepID=A0A6I5RLN3_9PSED|nr:sel1 repeat family protein [Pseudomonas laurentiana]NES08609.1 sel1 repeat family protein [Pseudomonas laurentiana]GGU75878.1 hypothetical protein GCM10009504_36380 [Pseudomonas laurentiana]